MKWSQPRLGHPAVASFLVHGSYLWATEWRGALDVRMEGEDDVVRLITMKELNTKELLLALGTSFEMLGALLGQE